MSKLSFRARALDATKPLPIYHADELPDLSEYNTINRTVPQMPTGMEKEEETVRKPFSKTAFGRLLASRHFKNGGYIVCVHFSNFSPHGICTWLLSRF